LKGEVAGILWVWERELCFIACENRKGRKQGQKSGATAIGKSFLRGVFRSWGLWGKVEKGRDSQVIEITWFSTYQIKIWFGVQVKSVVLFGAKLGALIFTSGQPLRVSPIG
jgi:hypothetical protein